MNKKISEKLKGMGIDWFTALLPAMAGLAYLIPGGGSAGGYFSIKNTAGYGISAIFFFYGLRLNGDKLKAGLNNRRLHTVIHLSTFVLFPALATSIKFLFKGSGNELLWLSIFYLSALPSTVSSSVVMVSAAGGNVPAAVFNASISSLIGVFVTPLLMNAAMSVSGGYDMRQLFDAVSKLILQVILPVAVGLLLNKKFGSIAERCKSSLRVFDQSVILAVVYVSFCESFESKVFAGFGTVRLLSCAVGMIILFFTVYGIIGLVCRLLKFSKEDTVTATFCGSKKSLVHGTAMSKVLFPEVSTVGMILLPIMLYHALQLVMISGMAQRMRKNSELRN